jgi:protein-L-isoaspartate O-methyltransferase
VTVSDLRKVLAGIGRDRFVPHRVYDATGRPVDRAADPERWRALVDADDAVTTQVDDGGPDGPGRPTSSSSAPSVMVRMLDAAQIGRRCRVLEIGTGTGWNTAALCRLTGDDAVDRGAYVTSVEVDPDVAEHARRALRAARLEPWVATGDGAAGFPARAPYDRVLSTCAVGRIPPAWLRQTRVGGRIVTPWSPHPSQPGGLLLVLDVVEPGRASGRFRDPLAFMWERGQRDSAPPPPETGADGEPDAVELIDRDPWALLSPDEVWPLWLRVPGWTYGVRTGADGRPHPWVASTSGTPGWARLTPAGDLWRVEHGGPRRIWDELVAARRWWAAQRSPAPGAFGLLVDDTGSHRAWFGTPAGPSWNL